MISVEEVLNIFKPEDLNLFLKKYTGFNLEERNLTKEKIQKNWKFVGDSESNASQINILKYGEKGLVERITNAIDAVIEKQKVKCNVANPKNSSAILEKAFPKFYENRMNIAENNASSSNSYEAEDQVILAVNDCSMSNKPTFDVIDKGTGIEGCRFKDTILSLNKGNKLSRDKSYLIGAFGQGGSTSLAFATATMIISKKNNKYYFTVVKKVDLEDYKNVCYVYMTIDNQIPELENTGNECFDPYVEDFLNSESGTLIRMIEADISKQFRLNEVTKPGMLHDYLNTELFNVGLPVKVIENRGMYDSNVHNQNRNVFGTYSKLQTWKYVRKDYSGHMNVVFRDKTYNVDYYAILPKKEEDWGKDGECKKAFEQFSVTLDPFIYIVNGQKIATESFVKLKNAGLNFMKYRLLVVIDLDVLGNDKYKFFTTDRAQIKDTDQTKEFFDLVVKTLANNEKLKELNAIISEKAVNSSIDDGLIDEISQEVKGLYSKYLKTGVALPSGHRHHAQYNDENVYLDYIDKMEIATTKEIYFKNQAINVILATGAMKNINQEAKIDCFIDDKANYSFNESHMNGRIQYTWPSNVIKPGEHEIYFAYTKNPNNQVDIKESNKYVFTILNENSLELPTHQRDKSLSLEISITNDQELVCDISKNKEEAKIMAKLCFDNEIMMNDIFGRSTSEEAKELQTSLIKPIVLFTLFMDEQYEKIETVEEKNKLIVSFIKTMIASR